MPELLRTIVKVLPPSVKIYVIGKVENLPEHENVKVTGFLDAQKIKKLFDSLDILVSASGQSAAEAVSCSLPVIILATENNQKYNYDGWGRKNVAVQGGTFIGNSAGSMKQLESVLYSLLDYKKRKELSVASFDLKLFLSTVNLCNELLNKYGEEHATNNSISVS
jgi:spore coat polysaccharide biosynthesis predicted glycosyltransferase SpsG